MFDNLTGTLYRPGITHSRYTKPTQGARRASFVRSIIVIGVGATALIGAIGVFSSPATAQTTDPVTVISGCANNAAQKEFACGPLAAAAGAGSTAVGASAAASDVNSTAIGSDAVASGRSSTALGSGGVASRPVIAAGGFSTAIGTGSQTAAGATGSVALGDFNTVGATGSFAVGLGAFNTVNATSGIAIGNSGTVTLGSTDGVAIGTASLSSAVRRYWYWSLGRRGGSECGCLGCIVTGWGRRGEFGRNRF